MKFLHISDLHFDSGSYNVEPHKIRQGLIDLINNKKKSNEALYLLVSGDITTKGKRSGFKEAEIFFENILKTTEIKKEHFIVCPGNHDITEDTSHKSFIEFDTFSYTIRQDNQFTFQSNSSNIFIDNEICFLSINTSYHLKHKFGKIDIYHLSQLLQSKKEEIRNAKIRIILFHHHLLNIQDDDDSAIKNAYNFFYLINKYNFSFIFHGHQHARQLFDINSIKINSISALLDRRTASNLIAYYEIEENKILTKEEYTYLKDEVNEDGTRGSYKKIC